MPPTTVLFGQPSISTQGTGCPASIRTALATHLPQLTTRVAFFANAACLTRPSWQYTLHLLPLMGSMKTRLANGTLSFAHTSTYERMRPRRLVAPVHVHSPVLPSAACPAARAWTWSLLML